MLLWWLTQKHTVAYTLTLYLWLFKHSLMSLRLQSAVSSLSNQNHSPFLWFIFSSFLDKLSWFCSKFSAELCEKQMGTRMREKYDVFPKRPTVVLLPDRVVTAWDTAPNQSYIILHTHHHHSLNLKCFDHAGTTEGAESSKSQRWHVIRCTRLLPTSVTNGKHTDAIPQRELNFW